MNEQQLLKEEKGSKIIDYEKVKNMNTEQVEKYLNRNKKKENKDSLTTRVFAYLDKYPESSVKDLIKEFPKDNQLTLSKYKSRWKNKKPEPKKNETNENKKINNPIAQTIEVLRKYIIKIDPELTENLDFFRDLHKFKKNLK